MRLIHNSRLPQFRSPFGAVTAGTEVTLSVIAEDVDPARLTITLRTWIDGTGEALHHMKHEGDGVYSVTLACKEPEIVWYSFIAQEEDQPERRLGAPQGRTGGEGVLYDYSEVPSFQITVYRHRAVRPSWYENGMVYQIFPDRYARDEHWRERTEAALEKPRKGIQRRLIEDWSTPPEYEREADGSIKTWDFYGGSLKGIEEDLPRIAEMGFTAIYLNPIFEAASNHRYDTADYTKIDPILGTEQDFKDLCSAAEKLGISIILDGVFNHTGDDSVYFNRYGNYPGVGAWQSEDSPWRDAFSFHEDGTYDCWWGIDNMPALNENSELVKERLLGKDGVIRKWLRAGAHGWRLDVADELTDDFLEKIKEAVVEEKPDGLLLGEVWEDASNKISYGQLRRYLQGSELDSAMDYPFRDMVIGYLMGGKSAYEAAEDIETLHENYPAEALRCALNLLSSHDRPRIISVLGGGPGEHELPESERSRWRLDDAAMGLAKGRFWLATLMQMTFPGVPSVYYGDEFGLEGLTDPGNRRTLPTADQPRDLDMLSIVKNASALRRALPFLVDGDIHAFALNEDVLAYTRTGEDGEAATIIINRSRDTSHRVTIPALNECASDVISGREHAIENESVAVDLWPLGSSIIYFHPEKRLQEPLDHGAGVVCHITSVPTDDGKPGTIGAPTRRFIDHLAAMGIRYWQVLPVNPTDFFRSPYAGPSAFAGNIDLLPESHAELEADFQTWKAAGAEDTDPLYTAFKHRNADWLEKYCAYMAVKKFYSGTSRHEWPAEVARYSEKIIVDARFREEAELQAYMQYRFDLAWCELMNYAHKKGIEVIGDIPMYVSDDSADAWSEPENFWLSDTGKAIEISGAPPDNFAPEGQVWGNPTFRWKHMKENGYRWWLDRLRRAFSLYDRVRLDHFLGFHSYYSIPAGRKCADGRWLAGPGKDLFERAYEELGPLNFIAEDLGYLTPGVRAMAATCGFPGMDVLEFSDYDVRNGIEPTPGKILYTSTHDTSTLKGWCTRAFAGGNGDEGGQVASKLVKDALDSQAPLVMMPLQDILGLGDEARMNVPGVATGNWTWQATEADVRKAEKPTAELMRETHRFWGEA